MLVLRTWAGPEMAGMRDFISAEIPQSKAISSRVLPRTRHLAEYSTSEALLLVVLIGRYRKDLRSVQLAAGMNCILAAS